MISELQTSSAPHKRIAVIIPCYNETKRLQLDAYAHFIQEHPHVLFCFVNDGSTDGTLEMLLDFKRKLGNHPIRIHSQAANQGKGEAVRQGINEIISKDGESWDYIGFWDSDLATPLSEIDRFVMQIEAHPEIQAIVGDRRHIQGATIKRSFSRRIIGAIMHSIISAYIGLPIHDTQCGAKLFRSSLAKLIFKTPFIARWIFDIELFFRIQQALGPEALTRSVLQFPLLAWHDVPGTRLTRRDVPRIFRELRQIKKHYKTQ